ncbi:MAG: hypothetical protein GX066_02910 [Clostridiaceae bacterium]|nr:hypothetical protein [Clostridiaceae bacterium]
MSEEKEIKKVEEEKDELSLEDLEEVTGGAIPGTRVTQTKAISQDTKNKI